MSTKKITGIVLAGGKSSRMGSDKGMIELNGKKFINKILDALAPNVGEIIIIANNGNYNNLSYAVYEDIIKDCGPIGGIYTGLVNSKTEKNIVVSCDIPFINSALIKYLIENSLKADISVPVHKGRIEPLCATYSKKTSNELLQLIKEKEFKMRNVVRYFVTKEIYITERLSFYNERLLTNINTPEELKQQKEITQ